MKDKGLYIIIAAVFFSPLALLFYIEWYWVLLIYNIFWAVLCYAAHSSTKNPKISSRNAFLIPLVFNLIGFGYVALKLNDDDETVESNSNDEVEAAKSRLRENILGGSTPSDIKLKETKNNSIKNEKLLNQLKEIVPSGIKLINFHYYGDGDDFDEFTSIDYMNEDEKYVENILSDDQEENLKQIIEDYAFKIFGAAKNPPDFNDSGSSGYMEFNLTEGTVELQTNYLEFDEEDGDNIVDEQEPEIFNMINQEK
tara:strand:+ start:84 stop:845 length:762 start_codon:yes stop_codon:yes gene_type:complete